MVCYVIRSKVFTIGDNTHFHGLRMKTSFRKFFLSFFPLIVLTLTVYRCFAHIINLAVVAFMSRVTKIAVVDNANLIWEYDPLLPDNRIEGGLDRIAALRTVITKVRVKDV